METKKINIKKMRIQYLQHQIIESKGIIAKIYRDLDSLRKDFDKSQESETHYQEWKLNKELELERKILDFHNEVFDDLINELTQ